MIGFVNKVLRCGIPWRPHSLRHPRGSASGRTLRNDSHGRRVAGGDRWRQHRCIRYNQNIPIASNGINDVRVIDEAVSPVCHQHQCGATLTLAAAGAPFKWYCFISEFLNRRHSMLFATAPHLSCHV